MKAIKNKPIKLIACIIICEFAGAVGSFFTIPAIGGWYATLKKSNLNPPNWIFGPVWTTLFLLMGISLFLVWRENWKVKNLFLKSSKSWNRFTEKFWAGEWQKANLILVFSAQLILNIAWSAIFFGLHQPGIAFFELLMLWFAILYTVVNFYRVSKTAAWLLVPYILWVSFAAVLNFGVWTLNL